MGATRNVLPCSFGSLSGRRSLFLRLAKHRFALRSYPL